MNTTIPLALSLLLAALPRAQAPTLPAPSPDPAVLTALLARGIPLHDEGHDPRHGPLGVWGAGTDYKVGFAGGACTFVPYLGEQAPHDLPWRWQTTAAAWGDVDLLGTEAVREDATDWRFSRQRGLVTERWDVRPHGCEQSFVVAAPPRRGEGTLVVRGTITTSLQAAARGAAVAALHFTDAASGYTLVYGEALAIDAAGRRCAVPSAFDGNAITLQVPADFVATASWPLTIDPLLQPFGIAAGSSHAFQDLDSDAIPGTLPGRQLGLVWSRAASATDSDLHAFVADADFGGAALLANEISATVSSREGSIGGSWIDGSLTIAWSRRTATAVACYAKPFAPDAGLGGTFANATLLPSSGQADEWRPRVGAAKVTDLSPAHVLIARLRDVNGQTELVGSLFSPAVAQTYGWFSIAAPGTYVGPITEPWVTKNIRGDYEAWLVAYQYWQPIANRWGVAVKRVPYVGTVDSTAITMDVLGQDQHVMRPRIDGHGNRYLIAYTTAPTATYPGPLTSYGGTTIEARRIDWTPQQGPSQPWPRRVIATAPTRSLNTDGIACNTTNGAHWLVSIRRPGSCDVALLGYRGAVVTTEPLPGPTGAGTHVAQGATIAYLPGSDSFPVLHTHTTSLSGNVTWTCTGSPRVYPAQPAPLEYGSSCGANPILVGGDWRIGTDQSHVGASGLVPGTWAIAGLSLATANYPLANFGIGGGCNVLVDLAPGNWLGSIVTTANGNGYAGITLPLPENLTPVDVNVQLFGPASGSSPAALQASRGVQLRIR